VIDIFRYTFIQLFQSWKVLGVDYLRFYRRLFIYRHFRGEKSRWEHLFV